MTRRTSLGGWFWALLLATFLAQAAVFAGRPMTSYRALDLGAGTVGVGLVAACFAALPLVLAIPAGRGVDGESAITLLRIGALCSLVGALIMAASETLVVLALGNVIAGVGLLLSAIAAQGIIARRAPHEEHDRAFGLFTVAASGGQLVGPPLAGFAAHQARTAAASESPQAGLLVAAGFAVVLLVVSVLYRSAGPAAETASDPRPGPRLGIMAMLRTRGMQPAMISSLSLLCCVDLVTAFLPVLAEERGISPQTVGWLLALRALASIASRLLVTRLAARWGRTSVLVASMAVAALTLAVLPATSMSWVLVSVMLVGGFALGLGQPLTMSWVTGLVPGPARATALAVRLGANRAGQVVLPATAGVVAGVAGASGVFLLTALLLSSASASVVVSGSRAGCQDGE